MMYALILTLFKVGVDCTQLQEVQIYAYWGRMQFSPADHDSMINKVAIIMIGS